MVAVRKLERERAVVPVFATVMELADTLRGKPDFAFEQPPEPEAVPPPRERRVAHIFSTCSHLALVAYLMITERDGKGRAGAWLPDYVKGASVMFSAGGRAIGVDGPGCKGLPVGAAPCDANDGHQLGCCARPRAGTPAARAMAGMMGLVADFARLNPSWFDGLPAEAVACDTQQSRIRARDHFSGVDFERRLALVPKHLLDVQVGVCAKPRVHSIVAEQVIHVGRGAGGFLFCRWCGPVDHSLGRVIAGGGLTSGMSTLKVDGKPVRIVPPEEWAKAPATAEEFAAAAKLIRTFKRTDAFRELSGLVNRAVLADNKADALEKVLEADPYHSDIGRLAKKKLRPLRSEVRRLARQMGAVLRLLDQRLVYEQGRATLAVREDDSRSHNALGVLNLAEAYASDHGFLAPNPYTSRKAS